MVNGQDAAQKLLLAFESSQGEKERHAGWRYFLEETHLAPGMDADKATKIRQARLDRSDSKSMREE